MERVNISRFAKAIAYECLTALLLVLSVVFQTAMHREGQMEEAYVRSNTLLFITAAALLGIGVYSLMSYTLKHRQHVLDSLFFLIIGLAFMIGAVVAILTFGGLEGTFTESGYTAVNVNLVLLSALPLPFWVRSVILAFSTREKSLGRRVGVQVACGALAIAIAVLFATGRLMNMVTYVEGGGGPSATEGYANDDTESYDEGEVDDV